MMAVVVLLDALCNIYDIDARARGQRTLEAQLLTDLGNEHPFFGSKACFAWVGLVVKLDTIDSPNPVLWMYTYIHTCICHTYMHTYIHRYIRCFSSSTYFRTLSMSDHFFVCCCNLASKSSKPQQLYTDVSRSNEVDEVRPKLYLKSPNLDTSILYLVGIYIQYKLPCRHNNMSIYTVYILIYLLCTILQPY